MTSSYKITVFDTISEYLQNQEYEKIGEYIMENRHNKDLPLIVLFLSEALSDMRYGEQNDMESSIELCKLIMTIVYRRYILEDSLKTAAYQLSKINYMRNYHSECKTLHQNEDKINE